MRETLHKAIFRRRQAIPSNARYFYFNPPKKSTPNAQLTVEISLKKSDHHILSSYENLIKIFYKEVAIVTCSIMTTRHLKGKITFFLLQFSIETCKTVDLNQLLLRTLYGSKNITFRPE